MGDRLVGKVAVVTGAASGIGLATARRFAAEGAKVVCADIDADAGAKTAAEIGGLFVEVDVTYEAQVRALFQSAVDTHGGLDIIFNNAGISPPDDDSILDTDLDAWRRVQEVNLTSVYLCCKYAIEHMRDKRRRLDHQHRLVRRGHGLGDVADLLHREQGRRARDEPGARRAVRPRRASASTHCVPAR